MPVLPGSGANYSPALNATEPSNKYAGASQHTLSPANPALAKK